MNHRQHRVSTASHTCFLTSLRGEEKVVRYVISVLPASICFTADMNYLLPLTESRDYLQPDNSCKYLLYSADKVRYKRNMEMSNMEMINELKQTSSRYLEYFQWAETPRVELGVS